MADNDDHDDQELQTYSFIATSLSKIWKGSHDQLAKLEQLVQVVNNLRLHTAQCLKLWFLRFNLHMKVEQDCQQHYEAVFTMLNNGGPDFSGGGLYNAMEPVLHPVIREYTVLTGFRGKRAIGMSLPANDAGRAGRAELYSTIKKRYATKLEKFIKLRLGARKFEARVRRLKPTPATWRDLHPRYRPAAERMYAWIAEVRARRRALLLAASLRKYPRPEVLAKFSPLGREVLNEAFSILPQARMAVYRDRRLKMQPFIEKNKNYKKFVAPYFMLSDLFEHHGFKSPSPFPMPPNTRISTDGVSARVLLKHPVEHNKWAEKEAAVTTTESRQAKKQSLYISDRDEHEENLELLEQARNDPNTVVLVIDPNKRTIAHCMELDPPLLWKGQPNVNQFRRTIKYTHMTRRKRGAHLRTGRQFLRGQRNYNIEALYPLARLRM
ncbi:hypothetical protein HDU88_006309 [Geranomyces variabilis]|nr:hypothetical protein HDU88_006309 [Geranomyces variabilis]